MKILALDMSTETTGFAIFSNSELQKFGSIPKQTYPLHSKDRYPKKSALFAKGMADKVVELIREVKPDFILIEEISVGGRAGVLQVKSLPVLHGMVLYQIPELLDKTFMIPVNGSIASHGVKIQGWRSKHGLDVKKNGCWKIASVKRANQEFGLELTDDDHDISDAILIAHYAIKFGICS